MMERGERSLWFEDGVGWVGVGVFWGRVWGMWLT